MKKIWWLLVVLLIVSVNLKARTCWGQENNLRALSDKEKAIYHRRLEELQKTGKDLYRIIINQDIDSFIGLLHEKIRVAVGVDYYLNKAELTTQLKDKNSFLYCKVFKSPCENREIKSYESNGIKTIKLKSVRDYLKDAKNLKITAKIKTRYKEGYYLDWGYVRFDWKGKKPYWEEETFPSPFFIYRDGKWWLSNMFSEN